MKLSPLSASTENASKLKHLFSMKINKISIELIHK